MKWPECVGDEAAAEASPSAVADDDDMTYRPAGGEDRGRDGVEAVAMAVGGGGVEEAREPAVMESGERLSLRARETSTRTNVFSVSETRSSREASSTRRVSTSPSRRRQSSSESRSLRLC